jgi:ferric-dicitrate binding protein FerR (iron transport regulator)
MRSRHIATGFIALLVFTAAASAQNRQNGNGQARGQATTDQSRQSHTQFNSQDRQTTNDWYSQNQAHPAAGFRQQDQLSPALESRLQIGSRLDPQLLKKVQPFPSDLKRRLPVPASGYRYAAVGGHVTLMDKKNQVQDIIHVHS